MKQGNNQRLTELLNKCAGACNFCSTACMNEKDVNNLLRCIRLDMDCAEICKSAAVLAERSSESLDIILPACAVICNQCAEECEKHHHMEHCRICAEVCRQCAQACRQMEHV